jgi:hypothetical protein
LKGNKTRAAHQQIMRHNVPNTKNISESLAQINEKLQIATSTLQQAIGGVTQTLHSQIEKVRY